MKIVMLGHSGVGKTTYIASLYGAMQQNVEGFFLQAVSSDDHQQLLKMAKEISLGIYPPPSSHRNEYQFDLKYYFNLIENNLIPITLADYRGGAIRETQNSEEVQQLIEDLRQASGIIMFCDGEAISKGDIWNNQIGRMTTIVTHALQDFNRPISLTIAITKCDLLENFDEKILNPFRGIISVIEASKLISGSIIPVASSTQLINIPIPFLFVLQTALRSSVPDVLKEVEEYRDNAQYLEAQGKGLWGFFDTFEKAWNGEKTAKQIADEERQKLIAKELQYQSINLAIKALEEYIQKLPLIQPGTTLNQYLDKLSKLKFYTTFKDTQTADSHSQNDSDDPFDAFNK